MGIILFHPQLYVSMPGAAAELAEVFAKAGREVRQGDKAWGAELVLLPWHEPTGWQCLLAVEKAVAEHALRRGPKPVAVTARRDLRGEGAWWKNLGGLPSVEGHAWKRLLPRCLALEKIKEVPGPGDWTMPRPTPRADGSPGWEPRTFVRYRDVPFLPPHLQESYLTEAFSEPLLRSNEKRKKRLTLREAYARTQPYNKQEFADSWMASVAGWPLKYVPRKYLEWLVYDGKWLAPTTVSVKGRSVTVYVERFMETANPNKPNVLREKILEFLKSTARTERKEGFPLAEPEDVYWREFYGTGRWDPKRPVWRKEYCPDVGREDWNLNDGFESLGTAFKDGPWGSSHGAPQWLFAPAARGKWNRVRKSALEGDNDPWVGARTGLEERGSDGKLRVFDWSWGGQYPERDERDWKRPDDPTNPEQAEKRFWRLCERLENALAFVRRHNELPAPETDREREEDEWVRDELLWLVESARKEDDEVLAFWRDWFGESYRDEVQRLAYRLAVETVIGKYARRASEPYREESVYVIANEAVSGAEPVPAAGTSVALKDEEDAKRLAEAWGVRARAASFREVQELAKSLKGKRGAWEASVRSAARQRALAQ